ncbi:hypothetical protein CK203_064620 [Vitis vinifera]|uniref:Uncharacterized protein n=1 Tax=Vitis vinifera TaxID=29760 RepID=A0A438FQC5_VITVI|nr:hypothetical protein CK203_064620 [Vitis vinifera]
MVDLSMGEHGFWKPFADGVSCQPDSVRAGSSFSVLWLHSLFLEPPQVWCSFNSHSHSHWPTPHKGLSNVNTNQTDVDFVKFDEVENIMEAHLNRGVPQSILTGP